MLAINTGAQPAQIKLVDSKGTANYVHVMGRGRVTLPSGYSVDPAWAAANPQVKISAP